MGYHSLQIELEERLGRSLLVQQYEAMVDAVKWPGVQPYRLCLFYKTGAAKTLTSLICLYARASRNPLVVAPPSTHTGWEESAKLLNIEVELVSHAKFRQKGFKVARDRHIIVDEFHLLGRQSASGWTKLNRVAQGSTGDIIICSATPNYNDAERCYCVEKIISPQRVQGGYMNFIYQHCNTQPNPFGMVPLVSGFRNHADAAEYLTQLDRVLTVPDDAQYTITDIRLHPWVDNLLTNYGMNRRARRIVASAMERRHTEKRFNFLHANGILRDSVYHVLVDIGGWHALPVLMYCDSAQIAEAVFDKLRHNKVNAVLVTGELTKAEKEQAISLFRTGAAEVMVGTASMATGTDGIDKVCDTLIIVDDTQDDSLRRQLIGRILPRGTDTDASTKVIYRLVFS